MHGKIILCVFSQIYSYCIQSHLVYVRREFIKCVPSEPEGEQTNDPGNVNWGSWFLLRWLRESYRHTFSEAFGRLKNWVNLLAGCKIDLWKTEGTKGKICYLLMVRKHALLSFLLQDDISPKGRSECFPSPDMEQVVTGIIRLSDRFECLLKCNCYISLIYLNNLLMNLFIFC